jgi:hypothetical protein
VHTKRRKIFSRKSFFSENDFVENILQRKSFYTETNGALKKKSPARDFGLLVGV